MRGGSHKLSGYRFRPTSVRGTRPTRTGPRQRPASTRTTATDFRRGLRKTVADGARPVALVAGAVLLSCFRVLADSVVGRVVAGNAQAKMPRRLHSRVGAGTALAGRKTGPANFRSEEHTSELQS